MKCIPFKRKSIAAFFACILLMACQDENLDTSNAETIMGYDARLDVRDIFWLSDDVIAFTAQDTRTKWETLYTISPEGERLWKWDENSTNIRQKSLSRFEARLRVDGVSQGRALTLQPDGSFIVEEVASKEANAPYKVTMTTEKTISSYRYNADLNIEVEVRTNRETGISQYFASNGFDEQVEIKFSEHTLDNTCCSSGPNYDLQLINDRTALFFNRSTTSSQYDHHLINSYPFEFFVIDRELNHEILHVRFQEDVPRAREFTYSGAGILIARDGSLTGRIEEEDAGIWGYHDGSWVRLYVGSVVKLTINPFDMCHLAFTTPKPNRRFSLNLSPKKIRIMNVCEELDRRSEGLSEYQ